MGTIYYSLYRQRSQCPVSHISIYSYKLWRKEDNHRLFPFMRDESRGTFSAAIHNLYIRKIYFIK